MTDDNSDEPRDFVASLSHGLKVITAFDRTRPVMTLSQVADVTGMQRSGARRYLLTLMHLGYVAKSGRDFRLTPRVLELGYAYMTSQPLAEISQPYLDEFTHKTGYSSALAVQEGDEAIYIAQCSAERTLSVRVPVGRRQPALQTSTGRAMLAALDEREIDAFLQRAQPRKFTDKSITSKKDLKAELLKIRSQGFSIVDQEIELGVRSMAVALHDQNGAAAAALLVLTDVASVSEKMLRKDFLPHLQHAVSEIERAIRSSPAARQMSSTRSKPRP
jgi:IclR family pca regulon transcriptional regulator